MTSYENSNDDIIDQMRKGPKPWVTFLMIAANVIVYLIMNMTGSTSDGAHMLAWGAAYKPYILEGEHYRLFTSMFLHFGISHLVNNMFLLLFIGYYLEMSVGQISFFFLYLLGGAGGNLISLWHDIYRDTVYISAGASGAVFAVMGALLVVAIIKRNRRDSLSVPRLFLMICFSVYIGFTSQGVDAWAHLGGLITGAILCLLMSPFWRHRTFR